jgi:hypothetical protein
MTQLTFSIEDPIALTFKEYKISQKFAIEKEVNEAIVRILRAHATLNFYPVFAELQDEAEKNGLTEDIIEQILKEDA